MKESHYHQRNITAYGAGAALILALIGVAYFAKPFSASTPLDPVASREVVGYTVMPKSEEGDAVVKYQYKGDPLPEKLAPDEIVAKRTESSYTRDLGPADPLAPDKARNYEAIFYSYPAYVQEGGAWYYRENATTTEAAFDHAKRRSPLASLFWKTAYAASIAPFSGAGDGYVDESETGDTEDPQPFVVCNGGIGPTGPIAVNGGTSLLVMSQRTQLVSCEVSRAFIPFNTSAMPGNAVVSAATLSVYVTAKANGVNDGNDLIDLVQTNQASSATLVSSDFGAYGPTTGATSLDVTSITTSAYNVFTLNATGLGWIKGSGNTSTCGTTAGVTCLGLIERHQTVGSINNNLNGNWIQVSSNETTGTSQDPFLSVTYTGSSFAFWQFQDY